MNRKDIKTQDEWYRWLDFLYHSNPAVCQAVDQALESHNKQVKGESSPDMEVQNNG